MSAVLKRYEPFVLAPPTFQWFLERRPADSALPSWLAELKLLQRRGWDLTVLLAPDSRSVVALGCRGVA